MEVIRISSGCRNRLLETMLSLGQGVYGNLFERAQFLEQVADTTNPSLFGVHCVQPALRRLKNGEGVALILEGLPVDPALPKSPLDGGVPSGKQTFVSEALLCSLGLALGQPSAVYGEKDEALIHQITPVQGKEGSQSNAGSVALRMHQDICPNSDVPWMPYDKAMATWLILIGLREGDGTYTKIATVDKAVRLLNEEVVEVLSQERFITDPPESFGANPGESVPVHSILSEYGGHLECAFDTSSNVRPRDLSDNGARRAIEALSEAFDRVAEEVLIKPGTAVLFNNRRCVHGRGKIIGSANSQQKRWLQRLQVFDLGRIAMLSSQYPALSLQLGLGWIHLGTVDPAQSESRVAQLLA